MAREDDQRRQHDGQEVRGLRRAGHGLSVWHRIARISRRSHTASGRRSVASRQEMAARPPSSARGGPAPRAARARAGHHRRDRPRGPRLRAPAEGPVRARAAASASSGRSRASSTASRTRPPATAARARSTSRSAAARCAPGAASTRCSAPTASARGWRGSASWPPARRPATSRARSTAWPARSSTTSTASAPSRSRASPRSAPRPRASASAGAARWRACWPRDDVASEEVRDLARLAGWARPAAARRARRRRRHRRHEPDADRARLAAGRRAIAAAEGALAIAWVPDPRGAGPPRRSSSPRSTTCPPRSDRPWRPSARRSASPAPAPRTPWSSTAASATARSWSPTSTCPPCCCTPATERSRPTSPPAPSRRSTTCAPARAVACAPRCARGSTTPGRCTRVAGELHVHPQTVRYRVAQLRELFGERLEDADARFELALALRAEPPAVVGRPRGVLRAARRQQHHRGEGVCPGAAACGRPPRELSRIGLGFRGNPGTVREPARVPEPTAGAPTAAHSFPR